MYHCSVGEQTEYYYTHSTLHAGHIVRYLLCCAAQDADQIIVAVVADKRSAAVARAVASCGVGAGVTHQIPISLGEQRRGKHACHWQLVGSYKAFLSCFYISLDFHLGTQLVLSLPWWHEHHFSPYYSIWSRFLRMKKGISEKIYTFLLCCQNISYFSDN